MVNTTLINIFIQMDMCVSNIMQEQHQKWRVHKFDNLSIICNDTSQSVGRPNHEIMSALQFVRKNINSCHCKFSILLFAIFENVATIRFILVPEKCCNRLI